MYLPLVLAQSGARRCTTYAEIMSATVADTLRKAMATARFEGSGTTSLVHCVSKTYETGDMHMKNLSR